MAKHLRENEAAREAWQQERAMVVSSCVLALQLDVARRPGLLPPAAAAHLKEAAQAVVTHGAWDPLRL